MLVGADEISAEEILSAELGLRNIRNGDAVLVWPDTLGNSVAEQKATTDVRVAMVSELRNLVRDAITNLIAAI